MDRYALARSSNQELSFRLAVLDQLDRIATALEKLSGGDETLGPIPVPGMEKFDALEDIERRRKNT